MSCYPAAFSPPAAAAPGLHAGPQAPALAAAALPRQAAGAGSWRLCVVAGWWLVWRRHSLISQRTATGMKVARDKRGQKFGRERVLTDAQLDRAIKWLKPRAHLRGQAEIIARKWGVSPYTLRNRVREKFGKRLWPKGPRDKT